jgi:hypothetical protein
LREQLFVVAAFADIVDLVPRGRLCACKVHRNVGVAMTVLAVIQHVDDTHLTLFGVRRRATGR